MKDESYAEQLKINEYAIDEEWLHQAGKYQYWSELHSQAILDRDNLKDKLQATEAKYFDIWLNKFDKKPSDSVLNNKVTQEEEIQRLKKKLNLANYEINLLAGAVRAFEHRKKALEKLTESLIAGINSDPKIRKQVKEQSESAMRKSQEEGLESSRLAKRK